MYHNNFFQIYFYDIGRGVIVSLIKTKSCKVQHTFHITKNLVLGCNAHFTLCLRNLSVGGIPMYSMQSNMK